MAKFLISWIDARAPSNAKKHQFTWVTFDFNAQQVVSEMTNLEAPKHGVYATFLAGS